MNSEHDGLGDTQTWASNFQQRDRDRQERPYDDAPDYAGFWRRFFAASIDSILLGIFLKILESIFSSALDPLANPPTSNIRFAVVGFVLVIAFAQIFSNWLYYAVLESSEMQATLGKRALGIVVTDLAGNRISFGRATGRYFARLLPFLTFLVGYLIQPFTKRRQSLHDIISGTLVIRDDSPRPASQSPADATVSDGRRHRLSRTARGMLAGALALVIVCGALGSAVVIPRAQEYLDDQRGDTSAQIATIIEGQVYQRMGRGLKGGGRFSLNSLDLDVNNGIAAEDAFGVSWQDEQLFVYGFETTIDQLGISVQGGEDELFRYIPSVSGDQIRLTSTGDPGAVMDFLLSQRAFGRGMEDGINQALSARGLRPISVSLSQDALTIVVESITSA